MICGRNHASRATSRTTTSSSAPRAALELARDKPPNTTTKRPCATVVDVCPNLGDGGRSPCVPLDLTQRMTLDARTNDDDSD